jgi:hypothetical protein
MALAPLTDEQRRAALDKAFAARQARADVKTDLKSGRLRLGEVLGRAGGDDALSKMRVYDLLRSLPGVGDRRALVLMEEVGIAQSRRLRGLGKHQKAALLEKFGE